jgi:excinuclease ABC subunit A
MWNHYLHTISGSIYTALGKKYGFTIDTPLHDLSKKALNAILYGTKGENLNLKYAGYDGAARAVSRPFEGVIPNLERRYKEQQSDMAPGVWMAARYELETFISTLPCPD